LEEIQIIVIQLIYHNGIITFYLAKCDLYYDFDYG